MQTERLIMRSWRDGDREPFARMNADPEVMRYFPALLTRAESDAAVDRIQASIDENGFGMWAIERIDTGAFIGFVGLAIPRFEAPFTPCVEVGWRLTPEAWGQGYATEAARRSLEAGFEEFGLEEIISMAVVSNLASRAVMERIGMTLDPDGDFDHPLVPDGHPLRRHVLYRISRPDPAGG
ncbi:RimJ/RimL family protein N-acetyltransferase [Jatrophihabitans sp. GAS493]|uniref:GNAT family N-acetyltransferase n=1 Tax=Jatrophihabitans sp. GAS493 TaxID=1907575 RepID=UPI000BBF8A1F|nr:GNAT family N-acetyltransferase [Jatrophihabitans sp. GAS493]SOD71114.1 RimJ/RimL family protein N-acetyltransferase [Jatrophihabitans sp. GAS493]